MSCLGATQVGVTQVSVSVSCPYNDYFDSSAKPMDVASQNKIYANENYREVFLLVSDVLHYITLHYIIIVLYDTTLHYNSVILHYTTLHYNNIILHYTTI